MKLVLDWRQAMATVHRHLGIGLCFLFAMWFASGAVMLFRPFPALTEVQRFTCLEPNELTQASVPASLLERASIESALRLRLTSLDGRPLVHLHDESGIRSSWVDTGDGPVTVADAERISGRCGDSKVLSSRTVIDDQWTVTVHEAFTDHRPLHRVHLDDPSGTVLYVSSRSGEVVRKR
jgi:hypothetical protein